MTPRVMIPAIALGIFALDRVSKMIVWELTASENPSIPLFPPVLEMTRHLNQGLLANLAIPFWFLLTFTTVVIGLLCLSFFVMRWSPPQAFALAFILGGALGNAFDRWVFGSVFDWILLFNRSVINVADIAISIGILWFVLASKDTKPTKDWKDAPV